jgi:hypothetical protein
MPPAHYNSSFTDYFVCVCEAVLGIEPRGLSLLGKDSTT